MYTRSYQNRRDGAPESNGRAEPVSDESAAKDSPLPPIAENSASIEPVTAENDPAVDTAEPEAEPCGGGLQGGEKKRFRAVRLPLLKERSSEKEEQAPCQVDPPPEKRRGASERGGLFRDLSADEMFIIALIVLLLCEGSDDILILALCFALA